VLKGRSFWQIPILKSYSWNWKRILKLKDLAKTFIRFQVRDERSIFLWHDHWHPLRYLLDKFGFRVVYDSGLSMDAKLSSIILNGDWYWLGARSKALVDIQCLFLEIPLAGSDSPIWESSKCTFSCAKIWERMKVKFPETNW
jgi:hypothetical protein